MRDLIVVANYTIKEMIKRKSFIISNIIILLIIVLGFNVPNILDSIKGDDTENTENSIVLVVDEDNIFEGNLEALNQMELGTNFKIQNQKITNEELKQKIDDEEIFASLILKKENGVININYVIDSIAMNELPQYIVEALSKIYTNMQIGKLGLTTEQLANLNTVFNLEITETNENPASGNIFAIMLLSIVLFYAIYFCAYQVSSSITTEKTSKIMETLVTSTTPRTIVLGKTIGIGVVGLVQMVLIVGTALISAKAFLEPELINSVLDMSNITPYLGVITVLYFILGYFAYALLYALTGSTVSKPEDIQSANTPVAILAVIGFYFSYFTMMNPTSELNVFASMFPISSPFCMPFRIMMGLASTTDVILSIAILVVTILIIAQVAIKIYSSAILNYGTKMSFKDIVKVYKDKNN